MWNLLFERQGSVLCCNSGLVLSSLFLHLHQQGLAGAELSDFSMGPKPGH